MSTDTFDLTAETGFSTPGRRKNNWAATVAPTSTDDAASLYEVGSVWVDTTADTAYVCVDSTTSAAVWDEVGGSGSSLGWFDVTDYGATGDGTTDDTSAVSSAITALNSAGRGVLYFPAGEYKTTGGFVISVPCTVRGDGTQDPHADAWVTMIRCTSPTASLFSSTSGYQKFEHLAMENTAATTPTAGSAIAVSSSGSNQPKTDIIDVVIEGFYDSIDLSAFDNGNISRVQVNDMVRYGLRIRNTENNDAGDWTISDCYFSNITRTSTAAIRIESGSGGKIVNSKFPTLSVSGNGANGILLIANCSIEGYAVDGVDVTSYDKVSIIGCQFGHYTATGYAIKLTSVDNVIVDDIQARDNTGTGTFMLLSSVTYSSIGQLVLNNFGSGVTGTPTYDHTGGIGADVHVTGVPSTGQVPTATGAAAATWQTPSGGGGTPATTVEPETTFGVTDSVGTDTEYARQDHTHGSPADPVTSAAVKAVGRWEPVQWDDGTSPWPFVYLGDEIVVAFVET